MLSDLPEILSPPLPLSFDGTHFFVLPSILGNTGRPPGEGVSAPRSPAETAAAIRVRHLRARGVCAVRRRAVPGHITVRPIAATAGTGRSGTTVLSAELCYTDAHQLPMQLLYYTCF